MFTNEMNQIFQKLKTGLPAIWDGKESIQYMKDNDSTQWRQMEWPGFYFQFMCERILGKNNFMKVPGPKYGNVEFDGFKTIPWDFKAHSIDKIKKIMVKYLQMDLMSLFKQLKSLDKLDLLLSLVIATMMTRINLLSVGMMN